MKKTTSLALGIILMCTTAWAQNEKANTAVTFTRVTFERTITLNNDSKAENVIVTIEPGTEVIDLMISSTIETGKLTIELFNPAASNRGISPWKPSLTGTNGNE